uniref:CSON011804 protein n=1 Tax=Culicoides sonorensis TaxID=179676 RepID=A0A336KJM3_CULSO
MKKIICVVGVLAALNCVSGRPQNMNAQADVSQVGGQNMNAQSQVSQLGYYGGRPIESVPIAQAQAPSASAGIGAAPSAVAVAGQSPYYAPSPVAYASPSYAAAGSPIYAAQAQPQAMPVYDYGTSLAQSGGGAQSASIGGALGGLSAGQASGAQALTAYGFPGADYWSTMLSQAQGLGGGSQAANIGGMGGGLAAGQASGLLGSSQALASY